MSISRFSRSVLSALLIAFSGAAYGEEETPTGKPTEALAAQSINGPNSGQPKEPTVEMNAGVAEPETEQKMQGTVLPGCEGENLCQARVMVTTKAGETIVVTYGNDKMRNALRLRVGRYSMTVLGNGSTEVRKDKPKHNPEKGGKKYISLMRWSPRRSGIPGEQMPKKLSDLLTLVNVVLEGMQTPAGLEPTDKVFLGLMVIKPLLLKPDDSIATLEGAFRVIDGLGGVNLRPQTLAAAGNTL